MANPLYYAINSLESLDANLKDRSVQNFVAALHSRMRARKVEAEEVAALPNPNTCLMFGPQSTLSGLKGSVEAGTADNHTFHFAFTILALYWELEKRDPQMLAEIRAAAHKTQDWGEGFKVYCQTLANKLAAREPV
jgi:hypothetical protein